MGKHHEPSATSAKKKERTKEYFRQAKRRQRCQQRDRSLAEYRDEMRREKRKERLADLFLVGEPDADGKYRFWTYRGRRSRLPFTVGDFGRYGVKRDELLGRLTPLVDVRRSLRDLDQGKPLADYSEVELQTHAIALAWTYFRLTAVLEEKVGVRIARLQRRLTQAALKVVTTDAKRVIGSVYALAALAHVLVTDFGVRKRLLSSRELCRLAVSPERDGWSLRRPRRSEAFRAVARAIARQAVGRPSEQDSSRLGHGPCRTPLFVACQGNGSNSYPEHNAAFVAEANETQKVS